MDNNSIFEAGIRIGWIESFYKTVTEKSTGFLIKAREKQFNPIGAVLLSGDYGSPEKFMHKAEAYKYQLLHAYQEYHSIKQEFYNLAYFNNEAANTFRLELEHQNGLSTIDEAISVLNGYLETERSSQKRV